MKRLFTSFTICLPAIAILALCTSARNPLGLVSEMRKAYWVGAANGQHYTLIVDSNSGIWFTGKLTITGGNTYYLHGFEKGTTYPTSLNTGKDDAADRTSLGYLFFLNLGSNADSVLLNNDRDSISVLPIYLKLFKQQR